MRNNNRCYWKKYCQFVLVSFLLLQQIPQMKEKRFILAYSFWGFSPLLVGAVALGLCQHVIATVELGGRGNPLTLCPGSKREEKKRGRVPLFLQRHTPQ
jgi:hypothetical protein